MEGKNKLLYLKRYIKYILLIAVLSTIILLVYYRLKKDKNEENTGIETDEQISWNLEIPENYNVKNSYMFSCDYFIIYYSIESETYSIIIKKHDNYEEEAIKKWIFEQVKNFEDSESITEENTNFMDKMPENLI